MESNEQIELSRKTRDRLIDREQTDSSGDRVGVEGLSKKGKGWVEVEKVIRGINGNGEKKDNKNFF